MIYLRWLCPLCGRQDPRHPDTKPEEMPEEHTYLTSMGNMWGPFCDGIRIPQRYNPETKEWENET